MYLNVCLLEKRLNMHVLYYVVYYTLNYILKYLKNKDNWTLKFKDFQKLYSLLIILNLEKC